MTRAAGTIALIVVAVWLVAHLLYIGPVQTAAEVTIAWALGIAAASVGVAAIVLLVVGLTLGSSRRRPGPSRPDRDLRRRDDP